MKQRHLLIFEWNLKKKKLKKKDKVEEKFEVKEKQENVILYL